MTRGFRVFEEVTGGSQRVTKGYWKLQGVRGN